MDGTVNMHNVWMYAPIGDELDFPFKRNNSCYCMGGMCGNGILLGPYFFEGYTNGGNYLEISNNLILP